MCKEQGSGTEQDSPRERLLAGADGKLAKLGKTCANLIAVDFGHARASRAPEGRGGGKVGGLPDSSPRSFISRDRRYSNVSL